MSDGNAFVYTERDMRAIIQAERERIAVGINELQNQLQDTSLIGKLFMPTINYVLGEALLIARNGGNNNVNS